MVHVSSLARGCERFVEWSLASVSRLYLPWAKVAAMNLAKLSEALDAAKIDGGSYAINDPFADECYTIIGNYGRWSVYYAERGLRTGERTFDSEDEACRYFLNVLEHNRNSRPT